MLVSQRYTIRLNVIWDCLDTECFFFSIETLWFYNLFQHLHIYLQLQLNFFIIIN